MRLKAWLLSMGAAFIYAILEFLFVGNVGSGILVVAVALIWNILEERKLARSKAMKSMLAKKYPEVILPDVQYVSGDQTATLTDAFVKAALLSRIDPERYQASRRSDKERLERQYAAVMTGSYVLIQHIVLSKKITPGNDGSDDCNLICEKRNYVVSDKAIKKCSVGDILIEVSLQDNPGWGVVIRLDFLKNDHCVVYPR